MNILSLTSANTLYVKKAGILGIFLSILTILYITQAYRIFLKATNWVYFLRVTEDYVLAFIFIIETLTVDNNINKYFLSVLYTALQASHRCC